MNQKAMNQVFNIPSLTGEEEIRLFKSAKAGDGTAKNKIIEAYMKLVLMIVGKYYLGGDKDDLIQVGNLALIDAVDKFDCSNGAKFSGFTASYIHGRIKRYLEEDTTVKRPGSLWEDQRMLEKNRDELTEKFGRNPTYDELYKLTATRWKKKRGWKMSGDYFDTILMSKKSNRIIHDDNRNSKFIVQHEDSSDPFIELKEEVCFTRKDRIGRAEEKINAIVDINRLLSILDPREQAVMRNLHGIGDGKLLSMESLARKFGVTRARIYQIQAGTLKKMKNFVAQNTNLALGG